MQKIIWAILKRTPNTNIIFNLRKWYLVKYHKFELSKNVKIGKNFIFKDEIKVVIGNNTILGNNITIRKDKSNSKSTLFIGKNTLILNNTKFDCTGNIKIGNKCHIGRNVVIYSHLHEHRNNTLEPRYQPITVKDVSIRDGAILYEEVVIMPNTIIGKNVVIGLRSIVTKKFTIPNCVVAGIPAKIVGNRFD